MSDRRAPEREFGAYVRRLREARGISQKELADRADIHQTYVSQLERGLKSPSLRVIAALAGGLGVPAWELLRAGEDDIGPGAPARGVDRPDPQAQM